MRIGIEVGSLHLPCREVSRYAEKTRIDRRAMGKNQAAAASAKAEYWKARHRPSPNHQRDPLDPENGGSVERYARAVRIMENRVQQVLQMEQERGLGAHFFRPSAANRRRGRHGLGSSSSGRNRCSSPSARSRGKKGDPKTEALGRSRGGFGTKVHLRIDANGNVISIILTPGQQHESTVFKDLMDQGAVKRNGRGRPKKRPGRVAGDKAYGSGEIRTFLRKRGIRSTIPRKSNEKRRGPFDREAYRKRNKVERLIGRVKEFRRIATRYEKRAANYLAMWFIGIILLWL